MNNFQGVACYCIDESLSFQETILKFLDLNTQFTFDGAIDCFDLDLDNKYYKATIQLFDYGSLKKQKENHKLIEKCHAVILYGNGQTMTTSILDEKVSELKDVGGEPRLLLYHGLDEDCPAYRTLLDWCIQNGYDFINSGASDIQKQMIDSLSAYKWTHRSDHQTGDITGNDKSGTAEQELSPEYVEKLQEFDNLLGKLKMYRDRPEMRGDPNDENIVEIAKILSNLMGPELSEDFLTEPRDELSSDADDDDDGDGDDGDGADDDKQDNGEAGDPRRANQVEGEGCVDGCRNGVTARESGKK